MSLLYVHIHVRVHVRVRVVLYMYVCHLWAVMLRSHGSVNVRHNSVRYESHMLPPNIRNKGTTATLLRLLFALLFVCK